MCLYICVENYHFFLFIFSTGHCGKCLAIIYKFYADHRDKHWLVIADDDTLLR